MPRMPRPSTTKTRAILALAAMGVATFALGCASDRRGLPEYRELPDARPEEEEPLLEEPGDAPETPIRPTGAELGNAASTGTILASDNPTGNSTADPEAGYRTVGGVLAEVNGKAIFTDEVIAERRNELRGKARELPRGEFLREAVGILREEIGDRLRSEFTLIVAERHTSVAEQELARNLATAWRTRFITDNGGSEAIARRAAREAGFANLDRMAEQRYREFLSQIFEQNRITPQILPSASELREAYHDAVERGLLTEPSQLNFLVIVVKPTNPADSTARAEAKVRADAIRERALAGEDFAELAESENDDPFYKGTRGRLPESMIPLEKGTFREPAVEQAAWAGSEGDVSVIDVPGGDFYVIRVEQNQPGRTYSFDEAQGTLTNELARQSRDLLMEEYINAARQRLDLPTEDQQRRMIQTAMEVVSQNYDTWRAGGE